MLYSLHLYPFSAMFTNKVLRRRQADRQIETDRQRERQTDKGRDRQTKGETD